VLTSPDPPGPADPLVRALTDAGALHPDGTLQPPPATGQTTGQAAWLAGLAAWLADQPGPAAARPPHPATGRARPHRAAAAARAALAGPGESQQLSLPLAQLAAMAATGATHTASQLNPYHPHNALHHLQALAGAALAVPTQRTTPAIDTGYLAVLPWAEPGSPQQTDWHNWARHLPAPTRHRFLARLHQAVSRRGARAGISLL
jgi:hypothetical protein